MPDEEKKLKDIRSLLPEEIETELAAMGEPKYRGKQIFKWLNRGAGSFEEMSDLSKPCGRSWARSTSSTRRRCYQSRCPKWTGR
jgi:23S rRNA (adenine2503-C2)-methyltransferase